MVLDYSERKQVNRNKARQKSPWIYVVIFVITVITAYSLGFGTAWYRYHQPAQITMKKPEAANPASAKPDPQPKAAQPNPSQMPASSKEANAPLTFYDTLPKGGKTLMGTGLNPVKDKGSAAIQSPKMENHPDVVPGPKTDKVQTDSGTGKSAGPEKALPAREQSSVTPKVSKPVQETFVVQVASSKDRKEAEEIVSRYTAKGVAAYLVESRVEGKGTWFRVRVGRRLSRQEADSLSTKVGKGAVVITD